MKHEHKEVLPGEEKSSFRDFFDSSLFFRLLLAVVVFGCCLWVTSPRKEHELQKLVKGQLSPMSLCADFDFLVVDKLRTEASRELVSDRIPDYYQLRTEASQKILQSSEEFFREAKNREQTERAGQIYNPGSENLPGQWVKELSSGALNFFLRLADNPPRMQKYENLLQKMLQTGVMSEENYDELATQQKAIRIVDVLQRRREISFSHILTPDRCAGQIVSTLYIPEGESAEQKKSAESARRALVRILEGGNLFFDKLFTDAKKQSAAAQLPQIHRQIFAGSMLLRKGAVLTEDDLTVYEAYQAQKAKRQSHTVLPLLKNLCFCFVLILVLALYLYCLEPGLLRSGRSLWVLGIILMLGMLLNRFFFDGLVILAEYTDYPHNLINLCLPLGFTAILVSVIFGLRTSLICGLFVSVVAALSSSQPFPMVFLGVLISSGGSLAVRKTLDYRSFFLHSFWGASLGGLLAVLSLMIRDQVTLDQLWSFWKILGALAANGLASAMLTQMTLILLESFFDLNTSMSLMICCDYNHPLLKEMQLKAPGTYHHCLMVASLAEQAAQDSGLDPVKARACGLYHDIGKIVQPEFFIENNRVGVDMHKNMDPTMSAMIIRGHVVTHGMELAKKHKLKKILRDAITQHHGNDLIVYFHKKAQELSPGSHVSEKDFRYPCPLPTDKEICVVMLSDCCEAASRSLEHPTEEALTELISEIFRKKIRSGQLDASNLTMYELSRIRKSFINTLKHMYHGRIAYPKDENKDENDLFMAGGKAFPETGQAKV